MATQLRKKKATTISTWAMAIAKTLDLYGVDPEDVFNKAGLDFQTIGSNPDARVDVEKLTVLWRLAVEKTGDDCFGLRVGEQVSPTTFHALGFAILASSNMYEGLKRLCRYFLVISDVMNFRLEEYEDDVIFYFDHFPEYPRPADEAIDAILTTSGYFLRTVVKRPNIAKKIELVRHRPKDATKYLERVKQPVVFSAKHNRVFLNKKDLLQPFLFANAELAKRNDQIAADYLERHYATNIVHKIHNNLIDILPMGSPTLEKLSKTLGMSKRAINQHLKKEHVTYQQILAKTRKYLARQYLNQPKLSIIEIAFLLGYTDSSNFSRAYKQWFGISPKQFRQKTQ